MRISFSLLFDLILTLIILLYTFNCSLVYDGYQKAMYVADYCPTYKRCKEGTHILCLYDNENKTMSERCNKPGSLRITMTLDMAEKIVTLCNLIRSKLALGEETGKNKQPLPRAYGMKRVRWDKELATLAQIRAEMCSEREDLCLATSNFDEPNQAIGKYTHSKSEEVDDLKERLENKFNNAIDVILRHWYGGKRQVTWEMINDPLLRVGGPKSSDSLYFNIIYHHVTHIGCALNYENTFYQGGNINITYTNMEVLVCIFSATPNEKSVYNTTAPTTPEFSKCGCRYPDFEDTDCLCNLRELRAQNPKLPCEKYESGCNSNIIILPIFSFRDASENITRLFAPSKYRRTINSNSSLYAFKPKYKIANDMSMIGNDLPRKTNRNIYAELGGNSTELYPMDYLDIGSRGLQSLTDQEAYILQSLDLTSLNKNLNKHIFDLLDLLERQIMNNKLSTGEKEIIKSKARNVYEFFLQKTITASNENNTFTKDDDNTETKLQRMEYAKAANRRNINEMLSGTPKSPLSLRNFDETQMPRDFENYVKDSKPEKNNEIDFSRFYADDKNGISSKSNYRNHSNLTSNREQKDQKDFSTHRDHLNQNSHNDRALRRMNRRIYTDKKRENLDEDDVLSYDRRKYYQEKLDNIGKQVHYYRRRLIEEKNEPRRRPVKTIMRFQRKTKRNNSRRRNVLYLRQG